MINYFINYIEVDTVAQVGIVAVVGAAAGTVAVVCTQGT